MKLSPNFTLAEFTASQTAARMRIDNTAPDYILPKLATTAAGLELVRTLLGDKPINISSGYRSGSLNLLCRGARDSQHMAGEAVDFSCKQFGGTDEIVRAIVNSDIPYDQVISEYSNTSGGGWVHISFSLRNRLAALTIDAKGAREFV